MNIYEILTKALAKAMESGLMENYDNDENNRQVQHYSIIFTHKFAKAFWGEKEVDTKLLFHSYGETMDGTPIGEKIYLPEWQYHLQQMVLEEQPLKYLEKYL